MLSANLLRRSPETIARSLRRRGEDDAVVAELAAMDARRREALSELEELRAKRNEASREIGALMKRGEREEADARKGEARAMGERASALEDEARALEAAFRETMLTLPNIVADAVPDGPDETGNVVVREEGGRRTYGFPLRMHWELAESLGITDFERGAKVAGRMFYALGETGARLQRALVQWMLDLHRKRGYEERGVPFLALGETMRNSGNLPKFADALYRDAEEDLWLIPTAEVPLTSLHADEILPPGSLPIKYVAHSPCFRRERAAAGSQVRGLKRLHQFEKVEMYQFTAPEDSPAALDELVERASDVARGLGLPFRILQLCSGDLSFPSVMSYDVEIWTPASAEWLEVSSCSNCADFQARRANIRHRREQGARPELVHTLNGSGLALPRLIIALLETFQEPDGSVTLPDAVVPYMGGQRALRPA